MPSFVLKTSLLTPICCVCSYFGILGAHTCHHNFSQIQKDLILIGLKDWDRHRSLTCHLEVGHRYVLAWSLHALKWLCSCTTWCSIMNGLWSIPMTELFWIHFLCFQKGLPLKISKKQSLEFHCRRLNEEWERRSCQVKCELTAVNPVYPGTIESFETLYWVVGQAMRPITKNKQ